MMSTLLDIDTPPEWSPSKHLLYAFNHMLSYLWGLSWFLQTDVGTDSHMYPSCTYFHCTFYHSGKQISVYMFVSFIRLQVPPKQTLCITILIFPSLSLTQWNINTIFRKIPEVVWHSQFNTSKVKKYLFRFEPYMEDIKGNKSMALHYKMLKS